MREEEESSGRGFLPAYSTRLAGYIEDRTVVLPHEIHFCALVCSAFTYYFNTSSVVVICLSADSQAQLPARQSECMYACLHVCKQAGGQAGRLAGWQAGWEEGQWHAFW